jgi:uncharacterized protein YqeY
LSELYDLIAKDRLIARKHKNAGKASLLTVLVGDIDKKAKDDGDRKPTDEDCLASIKKLLKAVEENLKYKPEEAEFLTEKSILEYYLPSQLNDVQLMELLVEASPINIGSAMSYFKMNFPGQYDSKLASKVAKEYLEKKDVKQVSST